MSGTQSTRAPSTVSPSASARVIKLHMRIAGAQPRESYMVTGSHAALGCWKTNMSVPLEWQGTAWETKQSIPLTPCDRVEFKFVRKRLGEVEWEEGPNRILEVPRTQVDLFLKGRYKGDSLVEREERREKPAPVAAIDAAEAAADAVWRQRYEELSAALHAQVEEMELRSEEQRHRQAKQAEVAAQLRAEIQLAQRESQYLDTELASAVTAPQVQRQAPRSPVTVYTPKPKALAQTGMPLLQSSHSSQSSLHGRCDGRRYTLSHQHTSATALHPRRSHLSAYHGISQQPRPVEVLHSIGSSSSGFSRPAATGSANLMEAEEVHPKVAVGRRWGRSRSDRPVEHPLTAASNAVQMPLECVEGASPASASERSSPGIVPFQPPTRAAVMHGFEPPPHKEVKNQSSQITSPQVMAALAAASRRYSESQA
eukprot:TRINITY_DN24156_c0_g1_i1.p1 TRINITY_DN24156_c0_g1~~TRINITY_DN24156_c0_g1_i1.p1  ORF type:complete len:448 (+),score=72.57 TRINITY_DN24156_c0_g1_i1:69-1346(+)